MKFGLKEILKSGLRTVLRNYRFLILLWGANVVFALIQTLPLFILLRDNLSHSLMNEQITGGHDFLWFLQFRTFNVTALNSLKLLIVGVSVIFILIQTFFMGGLVAVFHTPAKNHMVDFFYGGVKHWYRFIKVTVVTVLIYTVVFTFYDYAERFITYILSDMNYIWMDFILRAINFSGLIFVIGIVIMLSDYTKIALAIEDKSGIIKEFITSIKFIKHNFYLVFGTFLTIAVLSAAGAVVYNIIEALIPRTPFYFLILSFILQQMLIIFRLLMRMLFTATEVYLMKDINAEIINENEITESGD